MNPLIRLFIDPLKRTDLEAHKEFQFTPGIRSWALPIGIGVALLAITLVLGMAGSDDGHLFSKRFYFAYLIGWTFCLTVTLGAMFFVMIQHITQAYWSVTVRRIPEILMMSFPLLLVFGIPLLFGLHDLYHWTHAELLDPASPEYDPIIAGKSAYLNTGFFVIRLVIYFAVWIFTAYRLYSISIRHDIEPDYANPARLRATSAWGLILFAITTAFAGFDLLMSLDPHWFSTMFGVYFFAGAFFVVLASITMSVLFYHQGGHLHGIITKEHYHDLGKFMFAFTVFWAYIAFSQYMLIWYANLPEETLWFRHRMEGSWGGVALVLLVGHFILPFAIMIIRSVKRMRIMLWIMTFWYLLMHFVDLYWIAMPVLDTHGFHPELIDLTAPLGFVFLFAGVAVYRAGRHSMVPYNDPNFARSVAFVNA